MKDFIFHIKFLLFMTALVSFLGGCAYSAGEQSFEAETEGQAISSILESEIETPINHLDNTEEKNQDIQVLSAQWASNTRIVNMPVLDFADDQLLIMHEYFGLFIYNLSSGEIEDSLNLQALGEYDDSACEIFVSQDADMIWIRTGTSGLLYEYNRLKRKLEIIDDLKDKNIFDSFVMTKDIPQEQLPVKSYRCSQKSVLFTDGSYGILTIGCGKITDFSYIRDGEEWKLFSDKSSTLPQLVRQDDYFYKQFVKAGARSASDMFDACCTMIDLGEYVGICLLSENGEYSEELQKEWQMLELAASGVGVEETADRACYKIYINASDASLGSGLEKGKNEKYIYIKQGNDGWYLDGLLHDELPSEDWWN